MPRRGLVLLVVWIAFLGDLLVGAGFLLSRNESLQAAGLAMLLSAVAAMTVLTLWFYVQNRRGKGGPPRKVTEEQVP